LWEGSRSLCSLGQNDIYPASGVVQAS